MAAAQYASIKEISLDGFQVVSSSLFGHPPRSLGITCTLWSNSINFSKASLEALNKCENIRIEVNPQKRCILIVPVTSSDRDSVRWLKNSKNNVEPRKMECKQFTMPLFEKWGWDISYVYRSTGQIVSCDGKVMLLYNFSHPEKWKMKDPKEK